MSQMYADGLNEMIHLLNHLRSSVSSADDSDLARPAAVDHMDLPRGERGFVRREVHGQGGNFFGRSDAAQRNEVGEDIH